MIRTNEDILISHRRLRGLADPHRDRHSDNAGRSPLEMRLKANHAEDDMSSHPGDERLASERANRLLSEIDHNDDYGGIRSNGISSRGGLTARGSERANAYATLAGVQSCIPSVRPVSQRMSV